MDLTLHVPEKLGAMGRKLVAKDYAFSETNPSLAPRNKRFDNKKTWSIPSFQGFLLLVTGRDSFC